MKCVKLFLIVGVILGGCQETEEEVVDLDQMVVQPGEVDQHLAGEILDSPQEALTDIE